MIRLGIIGSGVIVERFLSQAKLNKNLSLTSMYSRDLEKAKVFSQKHKIKHYTNDFKEMLNDIDAIYIATPNGLHYQQAKFFLENKIHVLLEKTLTITLDEGQELFDIANKNNVILLEAYVTIHLPVLEQLKNKVAQLDVKFTNFNFNRASSRMPKVKEGIFDSVFDEKLGLGATYDSLIYPLQLALFLFGPVVSIKTFTRKLANDVALDNYLLLRHNNQVVTTITASKGWTSFAPSEIVGENGNIIIEQVHPLQKFKFYDQKNKKWNEIIGDTSDDLFQYEISDFVNMIENKDFNKMNYFASYTLMTLEIIMALINNQNNQGTIISK